MKKYTAMVEVDFDEWEAYGFSKLAVSIGKKYYPPFLSIEYFTFEMEAVVTKIVVDEPTLVMTGLIYKIVSKVCCE